jgi:trans-aconitate 2-methyltransferase
MMTAPQGQGDNGHQAADTWDPAQYDRFQREREQPFFDLLSLVRRRPDMRVVDLGCGTGALTRRLHEQLAARETVGIDRSENMLAGTTGSARPSGLRFEAGTIESFVTPPPSSQWDLIFSNAALHWAPDHERLIERLAAMLAPGGQLAFQVPAQHDTLTHTIADELAAAEPFRSALGGWTRSHSVLAPDSYARLLYRSGFSEPRVQLIVYPHILPSRDEVVEWVKGTMLTAYKRRLPENVYDRFVDEYRARLLPRLDDSRPFFYPFKRILCWGQRSA